MKNESDLDRLLRVLAATLLFVAGYFLLWGVFSIIAYVFAAIFLLTAITGFCGMYKLLGWDTSKKK